MTGVGTEHPVVADGPFAGERSACALPAVERRLGVLGCRPEGDELVTVSRQGPWTDAADGGVQVGAVGVLLDHCLGETLFVSRAPGQWSLTTELSFDVVVPPPWPTDLLRVRASVVHGDATGGLATGQLLDDEDRLLATASTWVRYVPEPEASPAPAGSTTPVPAPGHRPQARGLLALLGVEVHEIAEGARARLPASEQWANDYGVLHGGIWASLAELAASAALGGDLVVTHQHVSYLRATGPGPVTATARRLHHGSVFALVDVVGHDAAGRVCVHATTTARRTW